MNRRTSLKKSILAALFAALTAAGSYIILPIGPVPIVLANLFPLLAGLMLGPLWGGISILVYLAAGSLGIPVFSGGGAGIAHLIGPTGGFLFGYLGAALFTGLISHLGTKRIYKDILGVLGGILIIYACGIPMLQHAIDKDLLPTMQIGMFPFIPGDLAKGAAAIALASALKKILPDEEE